MSIDFVTNREKFSQVMNTHYLHQDSMINDEEITDKQAKLGYNRPCLKVDVLIR